MCRILSLVASTVFSSKRYLVRGAYRFHNRHFALAVAAVSALSAKLVHLFANRDALQASDLLLWGLSFFCQDVALVLLLHMLLQSRGFASTRWLRALATTSALAVTGITLFLAGFGIAFYVVAGAELHWRNIGFAGESKSWGMLLFGLPSCVLTFTALLGWATVLQTPLSILADLGLDCVEMPLMWLLGKLPRSWWTRPPNFIYDQLPSEGEVHLEDDDESLLRSGKDPELVPPQRSRWLRLSVALALLALLADYVFQPAERALVFMSWTLPLVPIIDFAHSSPVLASLLSAPDTSVDWDNLTAIGEPISLPWLLELRAYLNASLPGFDDWFEAGKEHYRADADPLKISNFNDKLLPELRGRLSKINIRHVMLIKLESTRKDVFPFKKDSYLWRHLAESYDNKELPEEAQSRLASLSPTANLLTGDYQDGFEHEEEKRRGGINFNNAYTTSSYTLKSLTGTLCGLTPLFADFNEDQKHHFYQPCLPHILGALSKLVEADGPSPDNFITMGWRSTFLQPVTGLHGDQAPQMAKIGYHEENYVNEETLLGGTGKFGVANVSHKEETYFGVPEFYINDYLWDAFESAKEKNERAFVGILTSSTHHPYGFPGTHVHLSKNGDDLSKYINSVGYVDGWLRQVVDFLDAKGFANETLLIVLGDHGIPLAENGGTTAYGNSHEAGFHVPMVLSHPGLPPIDVDDAVTSIQILPTILDLLVETGSLSESGARAARDLMHNYEGQSLLRPRRQASEQTGQGDWQFAVSNPGGSDVSVRDGRRPNLHLMIPIREDIKWALNDLQADPQEQDALASFDLDTFLTAVEARHGVEIKEWVKEAATVTNWYVRDNHKRWRYQQ
ncbi:hypothetical protein CDD83_7962 [Cordyceps sp. RAO-2017]|nr:hypothetical protein CDD83_7962 [Cordyceps sp. RAO-2017]